MRMTSAEKLILATMGISLLHHIDHVLRVDHSGWPFIGNVTPFTFSLLVYPIVAVILLARSKPRLRVILSGILFMVATLAHIFVETPFDQYQTWASRPDVNMLGASSPALGLVAAAITVLLSLCTLAVTLAFAREARRKS